MASSLALLGSLRTHQRSIALDASPLPRRRPSLILRSWPQMQVKIRCLRTDRSPKLAPYRNHILWTWLRWPLAQQPSTSEHPTLHRSGALRAKLRRRYSHRGSYRFPRKLQSSQTFQRSSSQGPRTSTRRARPEESSLASGLAGQRRSSPLLVSQWFRCSRLGRATELRGTRSPQSRQCSRPPSSPKTRPTKATIRRTFIKQK